MSDMPVVEYGNAAVATSGGGAADGFAINLIQHEINRATHALYYINDLVWLDEPRVTKAPMVDTLSRFQRWGWYSRFQSKGYYELRDHFKCRRQHIPEQVTLRWALRLWWQHRKDWR